MMDNNCQTEDKILTFSEVIQYLRIPKSTLYKLTRENKIPCFKLGKQLRFRKESLDKWIIDKEAYSLPADSVVQPKEETFKQILFIDDDPLVLQTVVNLLRRNGYSVEACSNAEEALEKVNKTNFNLIITDVRMSGIDGIEAIKRIRQVNSLKNRPMVPEIVVTGYVDADAQQKAQDLGISEYIYKPFAITDFLNAVKNKTN